jgi:DNA-binding SARP family transcriptional activator/tetratricopeptide (TPR) repeat protein
MNSERSHLDQPQASAKYRLRLLGQLALEDGPGLSEGAATRRRSLALLAVLASAGGRGVPRDRLLLYLWPESDTRRARNSLHQTLYAIRRQLGQDAVLAGIPNLQLNPAYFTCDLWDFEAALARENIEEAITRYGGPFLDGFTLPHLPEFEQWIEEERTRLGRRLADTLEASAARATREGWHRLAAERWETLARLDPLSSRPALGLMRAYVAAGNRAGALEYARAYEERVRQELGAAPDDAIVTLAEQLRALTTPVQSPRVDPPPAPPAAAIEVPLRTLPAPDQPPPAEPPGAPGRRRRGFPTRVWKIAVLVLVLVDVAAVGTWLWQRRGPPRQPTSPGLVAVFPFTVEGSPEIQYLGPGLVELLSAKLEGAGDFRSVDPEALLGRLARRTAPVRTPDEAEDVAARFGAGLYLLGNVLENGGRLHLRAALYDQRHGADPVARAAVEGETSEMFSLVDRLTGLLLTQGHRGPEERLARVAATSTESLDALKSYLAGERELRAGRYVPALEAFQSAVQIDTTFSLAYYRQSLAAEWLGRDSIAQRAAESAAKFDQRLSEHDRRLVRALVARRAVDLTQAERLYREVVDNYPDDVEAWLQLGQLLFQGNPLRGRSSTESRMAFERVLALDPENEEALVHLARIASIEGRRGAMDSLVQRLLALGPDAEVLETRAFRAFALGDRDASKRVTRELLRNPPAVPPVTALQVATSLDNLEGAQRFAQLLRDPRYSDDIRGMAYRLLARIAVARGQWATARAQLDSAGRFDTTSALELRSLLASLPFIQLPRGELQAVRVAVQAWSAGVERPGEVSHSATHAGLHPYIRLYRLGLLDSRLGDMATALSEAERLERGADSSKGLKANALRAFARSIRAHVAGEEGRPGDALAELDRADWQMVESVFEAEALDRFYRAELLTALGRDAEAANWYRTIAERASYELVYVAAAKWRLAQGYERAGEPARAREALLAATGLWRNADAPFHAVAADARRRAVR